MFRFGLPSFKLLVVGAVAAAAVAYYMGEFQDKAAKGARTTQPAAVGKTVRPAKPLSPQRAAAPASQPAKTASQPRPTKALPATGPAKPLTAERPAEAKSVLRPPAMLTGSITRKPRPPENLPTPSKK